MGRVAPLVPDQLLHAVAVAVGDAAAVPQTVVRTATAEPSAPPRTDLPQRFRDLLGTAAGGSPTPSNRTCRETARPHASASTRSVISTTPRQEGH
ncbi:hypothetical protein ADL06_28380 [Streptomyces sp. NRRL F-6491]|nr:hypothetical protein ADL06_28380 [Streptomyces sp. NRRL F-6491]KOX37932.1 hypothetical protein ADL08_27970 [Streptomyces sp. NRRL F-6492]